MTPDLREFHEAVSTERDLDLAVAALLVARVEYPTLDPASYLKRLDGLAAGVGIPARSNVAISLASANGDPAKFADPLRFDVRRENARDHIGFGHGRHPLPGLRQRAPAPVPSPGEDGIPLLLCNHPPTSNRKACSFAWANT